MRTPLARGSHGADGLRELEIAGAQRAAAAAVEPAWS